MNVVSQGRGSWIGSKGRRPGGGRVGVAVTDTLFFNKIGFYSVCLVFIH